MQKWFGSSGVWINENGQLLMVLKLIMKFLISVLIFWLIVYYGNEFIFFFMTQNNYSLIIFINLLILALAIFSSLLVSKNIFILIASVFLGSSFLGVFDYFLSTSMVFTMTLIILFINQNLWKQKNT
ncbi:hypothetical protein [Alkalihalophilus marmarensis]|uniref:Uncharacterized protein n=1 Tax=Alkalihalophilus marmarensis DSM 21297 TaxID=1188261 RepID=U6SSJ7_9BACI|nr:hypothetical protein [Alkalihalophilus marmarensis]ERN53860.1 hypothetical protein A33I_09550 [Alkalihalophilus marmarensis DSM 21297]